MEKSDMPLRVFCSFAPEDADFCDQFHDHLRLLERQDRLRFLHSRLIKAGTDWEKVVDEQLANAAIILLLISPAFFASDYCYGVEMQQAMQRHEVGEARVIPILLRPVNWTSAPFAHLSLLPSTGKSVAEWRQRDAAFADIVAGIRCVVEELAPPSANPPLTKISGVWTVPFQRHPFFTGQERLLAKLAGTL